MAIDVGDVYRLSYTNLSAGGGLFDADNMSLTITLPDLTDTVIDPVESVSTGVYMYDYQTVQAGRHVARWLGTGSHASAQSDAFDVREASPGYLISLQDAKLQLNIPLSNTTDDEELRTFVEAATTVVEHARDEVIVRRSFIETVRMGGYGRDRLVLNNTPAIALTSVERIDGFYSWDVETLHLDMRTGIVTSLFGPAFSGSLAVQYTAGTGLIPANYIQAAKVIVQHLWRTQRGTKGAVRLGGMDETSVAGFSVPNAALELLGKPIGGIA